ncbi:hypothetical protein DNL40_08210 [Xylanimonas oleitrophica]|uniref:Septum formation-related domain-containing protein n=1 Tax=Xylanimonas oleitrophica TaxID=2607479 RepID=A0A2W5XTP1_9MICO|nr:septum formation family protein [Xylanimonas oleitrophica]PZR53478.1 hypothetical protein DNL40_08210 [Xylanimonas oleitrophica]
MSTPQEPEGPVFAAPTPTGAVPDLAHVELPPVRPDGGTAPGGAGPGSAFAHGVGAPGTTPAWTGTLPPPHDPAVEAARRRTARRRVLLVVGGVLALALLVTGTVLGAGHLRDRAWAPVASAPDTPVRAHAVQLVLGSCIDELPEGSDPLGLVRVVPCTEEHQAQVVGRRDAVPAAVWPGTEALAARAAAVCGPQMLGSEPPAGLEFVVVTPSEAGWEAGDRASLCLAVTPGGTSGSLLD